MKKKGFTLAEVLVTLGIIGVVAALTTPAFVKNTGMAKVGPSLAKFVNTWEVGVEQMMHEEGMSSFAESSNDLQNSLSALSKHVVMVPMQTTYTVNNAQGTGALIFTGEGTTLDSGSGNNVVSSLGYSFKDGMNASIRRIDDVVLTNKGAYTKIVGYCLVDINGSAKPNKTGKDVFGFLIDKSGTLIPAGGSVHQFIGVNVPTIMITGIGCNPNSSSFPENLACTGKIADNGWKSTGL